MISGLSFEYAHARVAARIGQRLDERGWESLHAARGVPALLELARAGSAASLVSGVCWPSTPDEIEAALRQVVRMRIGEFARWAPDAWRPAVLWTLHLIDLPALVDLLTDAPEAPWIARDARLAPLTAAKRARRLAATLRRGPLAPIVDALEKGAAVHRGASLHPALASWQRAWRSRWPRAPREATQGLEELARLIARHIEHFAGAAVDDAAPLRARLDRAVAALWRQHPAEPVGLFAGLALFALDMERMRGELAVRAVQ